ncbi:unnamed protein product [Blepharisma stoltei]|uniref:Ligand-effect modulator 3 LEM3 family protein n=1 Tax=Blepharisma stoltei TaxID=1481888 RepID=A0AAU9JF13_9CILI|nr:unnamed protein product [Blepharisma stoltei]
MNEQSRKSKQKCHPSQFKAYDFVPNKKFGLCFFGFFAISCSTLGIILIVYSSQLVSYKKSYDCGLSKCDITITISEKMTSPVYLYYEIEGYYQNHRKYMKSRNLDQLQGNYKKVGALSSCEPIVKMSDLDYTIPDDLATDEENDDPAIPCGLAAASLFNDTFSIDGISIKESDIAWNTDNKSKYKNLKNWKTKQWTDMENKHFAVWMRNGASPNLKKLWGIIDQSLEKGDYKITIDEKFDVSNFDGNKYILLSTSNPFGGENYILGISLLISGGLSTFWVFALIFLPICYNKPSIEEVFK